MVKALADRLAEAFAEKMHQIVRTDAVGLRRRERPDARTTSSPSATRASAPPPATRRAPTTARRSRCSTVLDAEANTGITLTESFAALPASTVCGTYFWRPEARYFGVGRIGEDQVEDYAERRRMSGDVARRLLSAQL